MTTNGDFSTAFANMGDELSKSKKLPPRNKTGSKKKIKSKKEEDPNKPLDGKVVKNKALVNKRMKYDPRAAAKAAKLAPKKKKKRGKNRFKSGKKPFGAKDIIKEEPTDQEEEDRSENEDEMPEDLKNYLEKQKEQEDDDDSRPKKKFPFLKRKSKKVEMQNVNWNRIRSKVDNWRPKEDNMSIDSSRINKVNSPTRSPDIIKFTPSQFKTKKPKKKKRQQSLSKNSSNPKLGKDR